MRIYESFDCDPTHFAHVKRFRERWLGDEKFRLAVDEDPQAAVDAIGLKLDPKPLGFLWNTDQMVETESPEGQAFANIEAVGRKYLDFCDNDDDAPEAYIKWRARHRARSAFSQGYVTGPLGLHLPYTIELTKGCSLGCWFCGLSAAPLQGVMPSNMEYWEEMLHGLRDAFGKSAVRGFLYWASDPLDHPDYEELGKIFGRVLGRFPVTTTAAALVDLDRTKRMIEIAKAGDCPSIRFSVVTLRDLNTIHELFSPEELSDIDLVLVNRESALALAEAGGVRSRRDRWPERIKRERQKLSKFGDDDAYTHQTIACVSGFLIETVDRRVRLISAEPSSDEWPDGYAVFDDARYETAEEFSKLISDMIKRNMVDDLPEWLSVMDGLETSMPNGKSFVAKRRGNTVSLSNQRRDLTYLMAAVKAFRGGAQTEKVVHDIAESFPIEKRLLREDLKTMWNRGILIERVFSLAHYEPVPA